MVPNFTVRKRPSAACTLGSHESLRAVAQTGDTFGGPEYGQLADLLVSVSATWPSLSRPLAMPPLPASLVFASGEYVKPSFYGDVFDLPEPASVEDLLEQEQCWDFMGTSGTYSIIDVPAVVPADAEDAFEGHRSRDRRRRRRTNPPDRAAGDEGDGLRAGRGVRGC